MKMLLKFRLLSLIITCGILLSCNKQQNKSSSQENYEKIDYYSDSINTVRIDNISLTTINILNNWIEYQELKEVISSLKNNEFSRLTKLSIYLLKTEGIIFLMNEFKSKISRSLSQ